MPDARELSRHANLLLVFGGDGTMLRAAREIAGSRTPLLGVNVGTLGFLTAVSADELPRALKHIWAGKFKFESRALIEASAQLDGKKTLCAALNDVVISRGSVSRLIELEVNVNHEPLTRYRCDGLIVSSPTGSTAYSLAAGGALVFPTAEVFALTPISPHTLSNRSLILPLTALIRVKALGPKGSTILSADGEVIRELDSNEEILVRRSPHSVRLMHLADSSFFEALRRKLHWRGANV
ncbi:MAG: NAD(+)/NADH kinase [Verrucomicrobia bacterium]|nr:MAG: NAD(+)/NADH kinase [Verrucomicrobiota bacterium]